MSRRRQVRRRRRRTAVAALASAAITLVSVALGVAAVEVVPHVAPAVSAQLPEDDGTPRARPAPAAAAERRDPAAPFVVVDGLVLRPDTALPAASGTGRRVVFSESRQRVWLVEGDGTVARTYLVSGSLLDNLHPGSYAVYSRSERAVGIEDSGTMEWFVRFTRGDRGAAIGFHTIPVQDGRRLQTEAQLGTPQSHGCIRQATADALAMWDFAPLGTRVVVTA